MLKRLRDFFFPPSDRPFLRRYGPLMALMTVPIAILIAIPVTWEYSNSVEFCGTTCHTMPPEYNTYLVSPHARVPCVDCHIGRESVYIQFIRKSAHMELLYKTVAGDFEYPIRTHSMRPARDTCERCHYPEKFSDDSLRQITRYGDDEENLPYDIYLLMHTGGGTEREGLGRGIHWHIENKIEYITTDPEHQDVPWVRVEYPDGTIDEYEALDSEIDTSDLEDYTLHEMDCISCHNRISHLIEPPRDLVDTALARGDISTDIPFIRSQAVDVLSASHETDAEAKEAIRSLDDYYRENYPEFYDENPAVIDSALDMITQLFTNYTYTEQELDWQTHPNNIGHRDSPGCFRCHDGEHFNEAGEAVRLECNLCHSVPQIVRPGVIEPTMPLTTGLEPSSHLDSTWISRHHVELDGTCANCHTMENPGGTSDVSFCSNSGCHGVDWEYAGFDAPALAIALGLDQTPGSDESIEVTKGEAITYQTLKPLFELECASCHGEAPMMGLRVTDYESLLAGGESGPVIVPGAPDDSMIIAVLADDHFAQFTDEQMEWLRTWIADGAPQGEPEAEDEDTADADAADAVSYDTVQPVLEAQCGSCHGEAATKGLDVTSYDTLMAGSESGPVIDLDDPESSLILSVLAEGHFAELSEDELTLLEDWIAAGAPETTDAATADTADIEATEDADAVSYDTVQPVLEAQCGSCHGEAATKGLDVTSYDTLMAGSESGPVIDLDDPESSLILSVLAEGHFAELSEDELTLLEDWIAAGAPETTDAATADMADTEATEDADAVSYDTLQPVLEAQCGSCHGEAATKGLDVTSYDTLMAGSESGPVIDLDDPESSLILSVLAEGHFAELSEDELALLEDWIAAGAPETTDAATADTADTEATEDADAVSYDTLQPVLEAQCGSCHGEAATKGLDVTSYDTLMAGSESGPVIDLDDPESSLILSVLAEGHFAELSEDELALLEDWIAAGAPE